MAFRQALQLAVCGLAGGSAAVLFSAVAVGKPRAGGDAEPRVVEPATWAGTGRPGPGVWDPNWDRCVPLRSVCSGRLGRAGVPRAESLAVMWGDPNPPPPLVRRGVVLRSDYVEAGTVVVFGSR